MTIRPEFLLYLITMAGTTYLIRLIPMLLLRRKIENRFLLSFLYYVPYAVLSAMVIPSIFYASDNLISAVIGFAVAIIASLFDRGLLTVTLLSCGSVFVTELIIKYFI